MTSPMLRSGVLPLADSGPSSTFLRQLLDEINGTALPTIIRNLDARKSASNPQFSPRSAQSTPSSVTADKASVWVGGASIAQDARDKLRAADVARFHTNTSHLPDYVAIHKPRLRLVTSGLRLPPLPRRKRRRSVGQSDSDISGFAISNSQAQIQLANIPAGADPSTSRSPIFSPHLPSSSLSTTPLLASSDVIRLESPPIFCNSDSDISTTPSPTDLVSSACATSATEPTYVSGDLSSPQTPNGNKPNRGEWSGNPVSRMTTRTSQNVALPEAQTPRVGQSGVRAFYQPDTVDDHRTTRDQLLMAAKRLSTSPEDLCYTETRPLPRPSSPALDTTILQPSQQPSTLVRNRAHTFSVSAQQSSPSPPDTPSFARPLQLIEADVSIYKQDHGETWKEFPLCLYCFRQHGSFNRILAHGYEICGGEYVLRGHHWDATRSPDV